MSRWHVKNILIFRNRESIYIDRRPASLEGRFAIVTDVRRDAVDAEGASDESTWRGRRSRVVLTPRRWRQVSLRRLREATVAKEPDHRGEREVSRKPLRGECRVIPV